MTVKAGAYRFDGTCAINERRSTQGRESRREIRVAAAQLLSQAAAGAVTRGILAALSAPWRWKHGFRQAERKRQKGGSEKRDEPQSWQVRWDALE